MTQTSARADASRPVASQAHVWTIDLKGDVHAAKGLLSPDERARADRLRVSAERRRFVVARAALRRVLGDWLGQAPQAVSLVLGEHGKPGLARLGPSFNLSHSADLAVIAVCREHPVGVDIEQVGAGQAGRDLDELDDMARTVFSPSERAAYFALAPADRADAFYRGWTRKEAVAKALGTGLSLPGPGFDVSLTPDAPRLLRLGEAPLAPWSLIDLAPATGYVGALAVAAGGVSLVLRQLNHEDGAPRPPSS